MRGRCFLGNHLLTRQVDSFRVDVLAVRKVEPHGGSEACVLLRRESRNGGLPKAVFYANDYFGFHLDLPRVPAKIGTCGQFHGDVGSSYAKTAVLSQGGLGHVPQAVDEQCCSGWVVLEHWISTEMPGKSGNGVLFFRGTNCTWVFLFGTLGGFLWPLVGGRDGGLF